MQDLTGHTALVTGAGQRLGRAFALALAGHGASVAVHFRGSAEQAEEVAGLIHEQGGQAVTLQADLQDPQQAAALLGRAADGLGPIDLLVNSASIFDQVGFRETDLEIWQRNIDVNLTAPFLIAQAFARALGDAEGSMVNLLDWRALRPGVGSFAYTIAKAGLAAMTQSLTRDLAPGIRVNGLALGAILPPPGQTEADLKSVLKAVPQKRQGTVEEVVEALLFLLAGPRYVTGEILHIDGGRHLV